MPHKILKSDHSSATDLPGMSSSFSSSFICSALRNVGGRSELQHFRLNELKETNQHRQSICQSCKEGKQTSHSYSSNSLCCKWTSHTHTHTHKTSRAHFPPQRNPRQIKPEGNKHHEVFSFFMLPRTKVSPCMVGPLIQTERE